ncbi:UPF0481 protein At3g47200 [Ricinus communis]|uniref:Uncharacterized protein n=1 Tax=Ricinus communis TaxID=3988 RepID=B9SSU0_RICCO|nr:UPF0481 protein At3g47200 [Ricinus communis]EEF33303.1 conserved hypothetical protein [Ricinus communis]|eukprot:XP_002529059.1 UPF0481 protein At3g47200 [Ricinus communis]
MENQATVSVPAEPQQNIEHHVTIPDDEEEEDNVNPLIRKAKPLKLNNEEDKRTTNASESSLAKEEEEEETEKISRALQRTLKSPSLGANAALNIKEEARKTKSFPGSRLTAEKEKDVEERNSIPLRRDKGKSILLREGSDPILTQKDETGSEVTWSSASPRTSSAASDHEIQEEAKKEEPNAGQIGDEDEAEICSSIKVRLKGRLGDEELRQDGAGTSTSIRNSTSPCIFRVPHKLAGVNQNACQPELVSVGPYHKGKPHLHEWEEHKLYFLTRYLLRSPPEASSSSNSYDSLLKLRVHKIGRLEKEARESYLGFQNMSSHDFIEMILVDGCFVVELLYHLNHNGDVIDKDDPIFTRPELIPILIRDLLKLENQIPYFILELLFDPELYPHEELKQPFHLLALEVFNLVFERPLEVLKTFENHESKHLLDLFRFSLLPSKQASATYSNNFFFLNSKLGSLFYSQSSDPSIQSVARLRPSGIEFKSKKTMTFLDITFRDNVLEIPSITVDEFTSTVLINCVALEQTMGNTSMYFTDYVFFMGCLVNQPRDAAFLCSDGIITKYSQDDKYVADLFNGLAQKVGSISRDSYLSKQAISVESYFSSPSAVMRRKYNSDPLSFLSFYALLILILTLIQTFIAILSYKPGKDR